MVLKKKKKIHNAYPLNRCFDLFRWFVFCAAECLCCQSEAKLDKVSMEAEQVGLLGRETG